jgi:sugar lactone lactonase YvrE
LLAGVGAACSSNNTSGATGSGGKSGGGSGGSVGSGGTTDGAVMDGPKDNGFSSDGDPCPTFAGNAAPAAAADMVTFQTGVTVSTFSGSSNYGNMDGDAASASFENPVGVLIEAAGTLLVSDYDNNLIRRVAADGSVTTVTKQDGFQQPFGLGYGKNGTLYVSTDYDPAGQKNPQSGTLWTLDPTSGMATVLKADMGRARSFMAMTDGRLLFSNYEDNRINLFDPTSGAISSVAGGGLVGCSGSFADDTGTQAAFSAPYGIVVLSDGRIIVADRGNHRLRQVTVDGMVTTFAGDGGVGAIDGPLLQARFNGPKALAVDAHDNIFVSDDLGYRIRRVGADGMVTTIAGTGVAGWKDGDGAQAQFFGQEGLALSADASTLFVADGTAGDDNHYNRIRKIQLGP